jgi:serine/threonine-protein kinase
MKNNNDIVTFLKQRDYVMINNNLGHGSFGKTVVLKDPFIDELFVAKKYEPEFDDKDLKEKFFKNFLDEIKILHKLNHKNIVRIYNYYAYEELLTGFILMEYIDGVTIDDYIQSECDTPFTSIKHVSLDDLFTQLIEGFCYIENHNIIHRDIREGNIMVDISGTVKIIDFGIGKTAKINDKEIDSLNSKIDRANANTLPQEHYEGIYTSKTDMFYLGDLFHRLITNVPDYADSIFSHSTILEKMMAKNPNDRFSSFAEIKEAIDKQDFINMNITQADKDVYLSLANHLYYTLDHFIDERKFNRDTEKFLSKLEQILRDNSFENEIQNNSDLLGSIITSNYRFNSENHLSCIKLKVFLDWYKKTTKQSQQLILNNIISKLSVIRMEVSDFIDNIPF